MTTLSQRRSDWFFVIFFALFALSSSTSDAWHGLGVINMSTVLGRANVAYCRIAGDDFLLGQYTYSRLNTLISGFIWGPFYVVLVYAFVRGKNWIRFPALIYVGGMLHGFIEFLYWEAVMGQPPRNMPLFVALYAPYFFVPLALGYRMRRENPFGSN